MRRSERLYKTQETRTYDKKAHYESASFLGKSAGGEAGFFTITMRFLMILGEPVEEVDEVDCASTGGGGESPADSRSSS